MVLTMPTRNELFERLCALTRNWNTYEDVPRSQQLECASIGREINALGGFSLMQEAYRHAKRKNNAVSVIQAYWNGIGDWQW